jgi:hypothetical protein
MGELDPESEAGRQLRAERYRAERRRHRRLVGLVRLLAIVTVAGAVVVIILILVER